jgi:hypothetical protein
MFSWAIRGRISASLRNLVWDAGSSATSVLTAVTRWPR